mmetsp:Transcript_21962/g.68348  ORF Transcript_21962/g.68348 Transcript_21962/m.68348 type:complete len:252 (+) Transcript_21962:579-1334(+)
MPNGVPRLGLCTFLVHLCLCLVVRSLATAALKKSLLLGGTAPPFGLLRFEPQSLFLLASTTFGFLAANSLRFFFFGSPTRLLFSTPPRLLLHSAPRLLLRSLACLLFCLTTCLLLRTLSCLLLSLTPRLLFRLTPRLLLLRLTLRLLFCAPACLLLRLGTGRSFLSFLAFPLRFILFFPDLLLVYAPSTHLTVGLIDLHGLVVEVIEHLFRVAAFRHWQRGWIWQGNALAWRELVKPPGVLLEASALVNLY